MTMPSTLKSPQGRTLAYHFSPGTQPGIVFLGGFKSDMDGTKALWLEQQARARGRAFLRFDYSGHGQSSETFEAGAIGDWAEDALAVIATLTSGPQILVGSSMGGWISLLVARTRPDLVAGLVGIAAAPDFTEDNMWADFTDLQKETLRTKGRVELPSDYDSSPYVITKRLIEEGRTQLVLRDPLPLPVPVRLLHGLADEDVALSVALRLIEHADSPDIRLTLVKGADHRFSDVACLALIGTAIAEVEAAL